MKQNLTNLSKQYVTALRKHLHQTRNGNLQPALRLGRQAVTSGLETLELARIHEHALAKLDLSESRNGLVKRAREFFSEALIPIVETHHAARRCKSDLRRLNAMLALRTAALAASNHLLERGIARRKGVETALKHSRAHYTRLLKDSMRLQEDLRQLTHKVLKAQETERQQISCTIQDEIAQTLLGINVRLFTLKQEARSNTKGLKNKIASTQRLVVNSARSVRRVARRFRNT